MFFHLKLVPKKKEPARLKAKGVEDKALVNETAAKVKKDDSFGSSRVEKSFRRMQRLKPSSSLYFS